VAVRPPSKIHTLIGREKEGVGKKTQRGGVETDFYFAWGEGRGNKRWEKPSLGAVGDLYRLPTWWPGTKGDDEREEQDFPCGYIDPLQQREGKKTLFRGLARSCRAPERPISLDIGRWKIGKTPFLISSTF